MAKSFRVGVLERPSIVWRLAARLTGAERVHLMDGGLGNQLYQHAFAMALRKRDGAKVFVDASRYNRRSAHNGYEVQRVFTLEGSVCVAPSRLLNPGEIFSSIEDFVPEQYAIVSPEGAVLRNLP